MSEFTFLFRGRNGSTSPEQMQQTMKKWLTAQHRRPATLSELQQLLDQFTTSYNHQRPHRSLPGRQTPARPR